MGRLCLMANSLLLMRFNLDYTRFGLVSPLILPAVSTVRYTALHFTVFIESGIAAWRKKKFKKTKQTAAPVTPRKHLLLGMGLVSVLCLLVFGRNITFDVFSIDIPKMIFNNPHIMTGFSWREHLVGIYRA